MPYTFPSSQPTTLSPLKIFIAVDLVILALLGVGAYVFAQAAWYSTPEQGAEDVVIEVPAGARFRQVATQLDDSAIANEFWLRVYTRFFDDATVYPGNYIVTPGMSYQAIMAELKSHDDESVRITIPEGFSLAEMGERIQTVLPSVTAASWAAATSAQSALAKDPFVVAAGKPAGVDLEGYLFPDTYEFLTDATAESIATKMLRTMETRYTAINDSANPPLGMTVHDVLTLASIVEKEVRTAETMKNVADVFIKRLDIDMPLQSDATINYIIDGDNPSPLYSDLEVESPYNTYKHPGLPPGPIAAPGLNALTAVLNPTPNAYYYFLTTNDGRIYYGETYEEHLVNKRMYLR